jgi:hypothetical protein
MKRAAVLCTIILMYHNTNFALFKTLKFLCMLLIKVHEISHVTMTLCFKFSMAIIVSILLNLMKCYYIKHDFSNQALYI